MNTEAKKGIENLVNKYKAILAQGKVKSYNEAQTRNEFIEPFFEYLGWDMRNLRNENEVMTEETTSKGRIDLAFRLNNIPVMFLEAKALKVNLDDWRWAEQAINYSWNKGVTWAVLTDFESIKVFNAEIPPKGVSDNLFFELSHHDYINKFDQLWLLSREGFKQGLLTQEAQKWGKITKRKQVGEKLFEDLTAWRSLLSKGFAKKNKLEQDELDEGVQRVLDRLIFIRAAEDRDIEPNILLSLLRSWKSEGHKGKLYHSLARIFRQFDDGYNSKIFAVHYSEGWGIDDDIVAEVVKGLYSTKDGYRYDFAAISADVLGGIYEQYLGHVLKQAKKSARVTETHKKRKSQGIYYTPHYIVDYIVKETVGEVLKNTKPKDISKIKVLDPACGSGSFLTAAYNVIINYYKKYSAKQTLFTKFDILKENIYGVDLDTQAVEITQLNLLLKALSQKAKLPTLQHNIRVGNSLISGSEETLRPYFADDWQKQKPFNWQEEFKEVFKQGGFDVIIGNPPYFNVDTLGVNSPYMKFLMKVYNQVWQDKSDILFYFLYRGILLLRKNGFLGFIVSRSFLEALKSQKLRRFILNNCKIFEIIDFAHYPVFEQAGIATAIIILQKTVLNKNHNIKFSRIINYKAKLTSLFGIDKDNFETEKFNYPQKKLNDIAWNFINPNMQTLIEKVDNLSVPLEEICHVGSGMQTAANEVFVFNKDKIAKYRIELKWFRKRLQNSLIKRYYLNPTEDYLLYIEDVESFDGLPISIQKYLIENEKKLKERAAYKRGDMEWWKFSFPMHKELYPNSKLITSYRCSHNSFAFDGHGEYLGLTDTTVVFQKDKQYDLKYTLCLLNSKLLDFRYRKMAKLTSKNMYEYFENVVSRMPIYKINFSNPGAKLKQDRFVKYAEQMLDFNKRLQGIPQNTDKWNQLRQEIENLDYKINEEVYKLYELTKEEIEVVEGANKK
jgi:type I restriction-modification system DNA methylase subunit